MRRRGSNLGWIALIIAPFALLAKSLSMFSKAIMTLFKPSPRRARVRPRNYQVEDDVKRSKIALNKAKQGKIHSSITLDKIKQAKTQAEVELINEKIKQMREGEEEGWKKELRKMGIDPADAEVMDHTSNKGINLDTMNDAKLNAKGFMGCAQDGWIDATGKETKCPKCRKPLRPINW